MTDLRMMLPELTDGQFKMLYRVLEEEVIGADEDVFEHRDEHRNALRATQRTHLKQLLIKDNPKPIQFDTNEYDVNKGKPIRKFTTPKDTMIRAEIEDIDKWIDELYQAMLDDGVEMLQRTHLDPIKALAQAKQQLATITEEARNAVFDEIDMYYLRHDGEGEHQLMSAITKMRKK